MKLASILASLLSLLTYPLMAKDLISVSFVIDGKTTPCSSVVRLHLDGRIIVPKRTDTGFIIPAPFNRKPSQWPAKKTVHVNVNCGDHALDFPKIPASWVTPGQWEIGIAYPPYWIEQFGYLRAVEQGTWLSYLQFECNNCDPGVFTTISHADPPALLLTSLRGEQASSSGERARDIAYALAVFGVEYPQNREYLLKSLNACLARPKESPENGVCNGKLLDYLTNLYWRGDAALLQPLLQLADSRKDVIHEIGRFYGDLLDRHTQATVDDIRKLDPEKQRVICKLAGEDEYSLDEPKLERVKKRLHAIGDETATQCLRVADQAANDVPWRQKKK